MKLINMSYLYILYIVNVLPIAIIFSIIVYAITYFNNKKCNNIIILVVLFK